MHGWLLLFLMIDPLVVNGVGEPHIGVRIVGNYFDEAACRYAMMNSASTEPGSFVCLEIPRR
jgi:hypothetical protein